MEAPRDEYFAVAVGSRDACAGAQLRSELPGLEAADAALAVAVTSHFFKVSCPSLIFLLTASFFLGGCRRHGVGPHDSQETMVSSTFSQETMVAEKRQAARRSGLGNTLPRSFADSRKCRGRGDEFWGQCPRIASQSFFPSSKAFWQPAHIH